MSAAAAGPPPRRWLMDRINGRSKYADRERPYLPCCWVPPPVGWCPALLEENSFCRCWGWIGGYHTESSRFWLMHMGFVANLAACILTAYACLAISEKYDILTKASFGSVVITEVDGKFAQDITLDVGLRATALNNPVSGVGQVVIRFDQFCALSNDGLERYMPPEDCDACNDISANMVISLILSTVSFLPSFSTDIVRMYSGYDVNCQKFFGTCMSLITLLLSLNTMFTYKFLCGDIWYEGTIPFDDTGNALPPGTPSGDAAYNVNFEWKWGWALLFLMVGTALKFVDTVCNFCVPTPTVTRDRNEQEIYEKIKDEDFP